MKRCYSCFKLYDDFEKVCPYCGREEIIEVQEPIYLEPGSLLNRRYLIGESIGAGGFGIIYKAWDSKLETIVAVKEFFASRLVTRAKGQKKVIINSKSKEEFVYRKNRFLAEARTMAQFGDHRNIPNVFEYFEENGTAYIVMELLEGITLSEYLKQNGGLVDKGLGVYITGEVGNALKALHNEGIIHRDVAPDNIFICSGKELKIKLLDLGAAKLEKSTEDVVDVILKPGFSPYEQYDNSNNIGPWTDVYALGATLYAMITGIKPDESTNRKLEDKVLPPMQIDSSLDSNTSNAIMRAMAVERHMRFKTVDEFLMAINGKKKVRSIKKERKYRRIKRAAGVTVACLVIGTLGIYFSRIYNSKKAVYELEPATITVWYSVAEGSNEEMAMEEVIKDFKNHFQKVEIKSRAIPENEYEEEIAKAAKENKLPDLFESTELNPTILEKARDNKEVLKSSQAKECQFLNGYKEKKQTPLGMVVPVGFVITNGNISIDYEGNYFSKIEDFGENISISASEDMLSKKLLELNYGNRKWSPESDFLDNEKNKTAVLLTSSMQIGNVKEIITRYKKKCVLPNSDEIKCLYTYMWSLGNGDANQNRAADTLLSWMLGNVYQSTLMISRCNDGQLPINKECFFNKIKNGSLSPLSKVYDDFSF